LETDEELKSVTLDDAKINHDIVDAVHSDLRTILFKELLDKTDGEMYVRSQINTWKKLIYKLDQNENYLYQCGI
jgi:virulence-associated protein VapD